VGAPQPSPSEGTAWMRALLLPLFFVSFNFLSPSANSRFLTEKIRDQKREGINITIIQLRHDSPLTVFPLSKKAR
jgi:hypothetical protein